MTLPALVAGEYASLEQLMERVADGVAQGMPVSDAVDAALPQVVIDDEAATALIRYGLISYSNSRLHAMRRGHDNSFRSRFMVRRLAGRAARTDVLQRILLSGADGRAKSLLAFTRADCDAFVSLARGMITGWERKREVMLNASAALMRTRTAVIADLPDAEINEIATAVEEAWL